MSGDPGEGDEARATLRPRLPLAKRLNRNALTVAAVIMGMTVLTAIVVLNPGGDKKKAGTAPVSADEGQPMPTRPAFLDEPVRVSPDNGSRVPSPEVPTPVGPSVTASAPLVAGPSEQTSPHDRTESFSSAAGGERASTERPEESARGRAYQAAVSSSVVVGASRARSAGTGANDASGLASEEEQLVALGDSIMRAATRQSGTGRAASEAAAPPSSDATPRSKRTALSESFSRRAVDGTSSTTIAQLEPAGSPYTLRAGTVIPGLLITAITSDLPGEIVGQVSRDVYDSRTQRIPLIPKGSRLIGTYDNQVAAGQGRLLVAWTRMILPDGRSLRLPGLPLTDPAGQSGAKDKVDTHWRRVFGNAVLLSAISAGVQLSQPRQASVLSSPSPGQVAAGAVGQELSSVALEILRRGMDVAPTISIRAGQPFNVFLSGDLVFDGPYDPGA